MMNRYSQFDVPRMPGTILIASSAGLAGRIAAVHRPHTWIIKTGFQWSAVGIKGNGARNFDNGTFADILIRVETAG